MNETATKKTQQFQTETRKVLDIVIHSLYTQREIFIRELVSNAADALEKVRLEKLQNENITGADLPLEIRIDVDEACKTVTITDTGIGMTEAEVVENLGTIAHSGTLEFVKRQKDTGSTAADLIGQFGVGFYSAFMVAKNVTVHTRSFQPDTEGVEWVSDGLGEYTVAPKEDLQRGTRIVIELKDDADEFAAAARVREIVKQYSNFVTFPIYINNEQANTVQALWTRNKNEITPEEYNEFYKYIAHAYDEPMLRLHYSADAPIQFNSVLFVPSDNVERFGMSRYEPGVNLYCRKVLIQQHSELILPEWMRFAKGVVDCEDLPLNISRETLQDNVVMRKLKKVVTSRFLKFLAEQQKNEKETYEKFWQTFGVFIKEGAIQDVENREQILPLLYFETSAMEAGTNVTLADYVSRMKPDDKHIYYINGTSRDLIESSPYLEAFKKRGIEVFYLYNPIDDFVMNAVGEYEGKTLVSVEQAELDLPDDADKDEQDVPQPLNADQREELCGWIKSALGEKVEAVRESKRLVDSPAVIVNSTPGLTGNMQKILRASSPELGAFNRLSLEINPSHPIFQSLHASKASGEAEDRFNAAVEYLYENALMAAGLIDDPRSMVKRNYEMLAKALGS